MLIVRRDLKKTTSLRHIIIQNGLEGNPSPRRVNLEELLICFYLQYETAYN
jgi:hypothetical protein